MLGVPSNDFKQEDADSEKTAKVCYANYGVTYTMTKTQSVRGADAIPLFAELASQSSAPKWNFYKYLIDRDGNGTLETRHKGPYDPVIVPNWVLFSW